MKLRMRFADKKKIASKMLLAHTYINNNDSLINTLYV